MSLPQEISVYRQFITERANSKDFADYLADLTQRLIDIDNTPTRSLANIVKHERQAFDLLETEIRKYLSPEMVIEHVPINPAIAHHPYYTRPYYTADADHPDGLDAESTYHDRFNLLVRTDLDQRRRKGKPLVINAHIDTVAPHHGPSFDGRYVCGRGACDDKGSAVMLIGLLRLWHEMEQKFGPIPSQPRVLQFVIEEETGGNGSLSLSLDERFRGFEIIVCEATGNHPHPANRGAMWFRFTIDTSGTDYNAMDILPFLITELAGEGRKLRQETNQPLFPRDYVQVSFGTLNSFGRHTSGINDYLAFELTVRCKNGTSAKAAARLPEIIAAGVKDYCVVYPDRTREMDEHTGQAKLAAHYRLTPLTETSQEQVHKLEVFGLGGHMSTLALRDNAIIKAGYVLQGVICAFKNLPGISLQVKLLEENFDPKKITVSGGVGFTPAHRMSQLQRRLYEASIHGLAMHNRCVKAAAPETVFNIFYDMLHNEAYASLTDCPTMRAFDWAFKQAEVPWPRLVAFRASCDARIFGNSGHNTVTFGPGNLADAHSDHEKIELRELQKGLELVTLTTLALITGQYQDVALDTMEEAVG